MRGNEGNKGIRTTGNRPRKIPVFCSPARCTRLSAEPEKTLPKAGILASRQWRARAVSCRLRPPPFGPPSSSTPTSRPYRRTTNPSAQAHRPRQPPHGNAAPNSRPPSIGANQVAHPRQVPDLRPRALKRRLKSRIRNFACLQLDGWIRSSSSTFAHRSSSRGTQQQIIDQEKHCT